MSNITQKFLNSRSLIFIFLLIIGFSLYVNSLSNRMFWDDDDNVVNNIFIKDWKYLPNIFKENLIAGAGLQSNYYRPLLLITYAFDYRIWGLHPFGYHLTNTLLHVLNAFLIFLIIAFLIKKKTVALLVSLLFLIHPLQTEAITPVAGRADPLFVFFLLLSFWLFIKFQNLTQKKFILLSSLFFILSLLSKEIAIVLPALLILYLVCFKERKINWSSIKKIAISIWPFLLIALIYFILRLTVLNFGGTLNLYQEENLFTSRLDIRLLTFFKVLLVYYRLIFVPLGLHMDRSIPLATSIFQWQVLLSLLILTGIAIAIRMGAFGLPECKEQSDECEGALFGCIKSWQKERVVFFAFGWFFINLLPTSNIVPVSGLLYEHWLYLPLVGIFLVGAIFLEKLWQKLGHPNSAPPSSDGHRRTSATRMRPPEFKYYLKWPLIILLIIYLGFFSVLTIKRNFDWHDPITFYEKNLKYVSVPREYNNLGNAYADKGEYEKAIAQYQKAISLSDIYPQVHYNLANSYRNSGRAKEATAEYKKAIQMDKNFTPAYYNLSSLYLEIGQNSEALNILFELEKIIPKDPRLWYNLGMTYYSLKDYSSAINQWQKILFEEPTNPAILNLIKQAEIEQTK